MGNVEVRHVPTHHEDNFQSSQNYHPAPSSCSSSADFSRPKSSRLLPLISASLAITGLFIMGGAWMLSDIKGPIMMPAPMDFDPPLVVISNPTMPEPSNPNTSLPTIEVAELGSLSGGNFSPHSSFKSGDLLTLRLRVSRECYLRVFYLSADGKIMLITPQTIEASQRIKGGTYVHVPDLHDPLSKEPKYALRLYHDTGVGPPLRESIFIQVSDEPFSFEGTTQIPNLPIPIFVDTSVDRALTFGVRAVSGLSVDEARKEMHKILNQRQLDLTIAP